MEVQELTSRLEGAGSVEEARELLATNCKAPGVSRAYLDRTLELFGADQAALGRFGRWAKLVVQYGDDRATAYRALGVTEHVQGRFRESADAFVKAGQFAANQRDHFTYQTGAVDALGRSGRSGEAIMLADRLQRGLNAMGEPGLAARVRVNVANTYLAQDRYREARNALRGLPDVLEQHGYAVEAINARLALSTSHLFGGDPEAARVEATEVVRRADELGLLHFSRHARLNLAYVALLRGQCDECLSSLVTLREEFAGSPADEVRILEYLGDAHSRLNLWPEAIDAYRTALAQSDYAAPLHRAHLALGLGQALLGNGEVQEAMRELRDASGRYRKVGNQAWEAAAATAEAEAMNSVGRKGASKRAAEAADLARASKSPYHLARALLVQALCCQDAAALDEAGKLVKKYQFGGLEWRLHVARARLEPEKALNHYRKMFEAVLRERAYATSTASRASYLRDKGEAVREYLELLLNEPTKKRVEEAVSVIERSRSVALLDEIMAARGDAFAEDVLAEIESLRREMEGSLASDPTGDGSRAMVDRPADLSGFQRRWLEQTHRLITSIEAPTVRRPDTASFVTTRNGVHVLANGQAWRLPVTPDALAERLKWLQFELLEPMVDRNADPTRALEALKSLGQDLLLPWAIESHASGMTPDGSLWRVPWTACCAAANVETLELRLHPGLGGSPAVVPERPLAALWVAEHADLRHANREAEAFLDVFPDAVVARTAAEAREMLGGRFDILHVVAHARHRWTNPMFSSVEFRDGSVFASEIAQSSLAVGFVMLSACDTGAMSLTCQDEPDGFARAFLGRGAGAVIGSAWPLDDEAGSRLSQSFYRAFVTGLDVLQSLRLAQEETRSWRAHPYFWASHLLYGGYHA
ncbi:MAG: CHAT domain-containing protein [Fimbriimonas sp.]